MGWHGLSPSRDVDSLLESAGGLAVAHRILAGVDAHFDVRGGRSGHLPGAVVGYLVNCRPELVGRLHALLDALGNRLVRWHNVAPLSWLQFLVVIEAHVISMTALSLDLSGNSKGFLRVFSARSGTMPRAGRARRSRQPY